MARTLHFDCFSGISGDMTLGALIDLGAPLDEIRARLDGLELPITLHVEKIRKGGFAATQVWVQAPEEKDHRHLPEIEAILGRGSLTESQKDLALRIFRRLAEAEAESHGIAIDRVHFHEVGALDSITDIAGVAIALDLLKIERFTSRSVVTGQGTVKCAHGVMPVPAPATAHLLRGAPLAASPIKSELTTPTGAAILATLVQEWVESPAMLLQAIGHGAGMKDFLEQPNLLRVFLGETTSTDPCSDQVWHLETNLDDVPGEWIAYTFDPLFSAGALDVFTIPITMKKNRPAVLLNVLVSDAHRSAVEQVIFRETRTFGIRRNLVQRSKLRREEITLQTPWGSVRGKRGWRDGIDIITPEYEDCAKLAREHSIPLREVYSQAISAPISRNSS